ncbi:MAG: DUF192 domain-containing protein [Dehalococcoidia bacterium]
MTRRWSPTVVLAIVVTVLLSGCARDAYGGRTAAQGESEFPAVIFTAADGHTAKMTVEVADTPELSQCGLMHRLSMPDDHGMLFVFQADYDGGFWNRNTFIPLQLAWIAADGSIVGLTDMQQVRPEDMPQVNTTYPAPGPSRYVIEANKDWFSRNGIGPGDKAEVQTAVAHGSRDAAPICREKGY